MPRKRTRSAPEPAPIQGEEPPMPTPKPEDPTTETPTPAEPADELMSDPETHDPLPDGRGSAPTPTSTPDPRTAIPDAVLADLPLMQPADFGSVALIDAELARMGDPWEEFKNGPVAKLNRAKAEREQGRKALDDAVNQAQLEHDRAREAMDPRLDRVNRLKIRRAALMR